MPPAKGELREDDRTGPRSIEVVLRSEKASGRIVHLPPSGIAAGTPPNALCTTDEKPPGWKDAGPGRRYGLAPLCCCNPRLPCSHDRRRRGRLRAELSDKADSHFRRRGP